ncbi:hypothetical protein PRIPAC_86592 [Pristionchus pacificus]|uniref:Membrane transporter n=1 Tax=Pristionchus pacificus TaxID=54126 RepID=A0A2A6CBZ3_PRIPA|nr:hypothetical protein PRIPAC_86592 [Pristionchus pacificus]|eukprot:PDM75745.1 membrane transporter [Pristionchus pacificus]
MSESGESARGSDAASTIPADAESDFDESAATDTTVDPAAGAQVERSDEGVKRPKKYMRFLILALSTLCITQILANQNSYNFSKICVVKGIDPSANYTTNQMSVMRSAPAIGSFIALLPMVYLLEKLPRKIILLVCGGITTVATGLVPLVEPMGFGWFLAARILQGVSFCATFPIAGFVTAQWASLKEHGIFLAFLTGFSQLSQMYLFAIGGIGCSVFTWQSVYYFMAVSGALIFVLFGYFYTDRPHENSRVSPEELAWILKDKTDKNPVKEPVPYKSMFKSKVIWAVWTSAFADILAITFLHMYVPQYFKDYLKFDILKVGCYGAIPMIVQWLCKIFSGWSSDKIKSISENMKLKIYNSIALGGSGVFFMILSFVPASSQWGCFVVLKVAIQALCILIEPQITGHILTDNTPFQWGAVLWLHAILLIAATVLFLFWARAEAAPWTEPIETEPVSDELEKVEVVEVVESKDDSLAEIPDSTAPTERTMQETTPP